MKSSTGAYFERLDHVRAFACYAVVMWHLLHHEGKPVPLEYTPWFPPLSLIDEGHVGVSIFMTLSGYLFARIIGDRQISYPLFLYNRILRLAPLFAAVLLAQLALTFFSDGSLRGLIKSVVLGFVLPTWPNGGWSIATEMHFYILLPVLLFAFRRHTVAAPLAVLALAIALRTVLWLQLGQVELLAYWTIIGRIDQFTLGMMLAYFAPLMRGRNVIAAITLSVFVLGYYAFNAAGGFVDFGGRGYPSPAPVWIIFPTFEAISIAVLIAWYDQTPLFKSNRVSRAVAQIGVASYSIYLLHFFVVFQASHLLARMGLSYAGNMAVGTVIFLLLVPVGLASFYGYERHFLQFRCRYTLPEGHITRTFGRSRNSIAWIEGTRAR